MSAKFKKNKDDSPFLMYIIAFVMFVMLTITLLSFMRSEDSPVYLNFDKEILNAESKKAEIKKQMNEKDFIDKAYDKLGEDVRYDKYQATYDQYRQQQLRKRQQEFEQRQRLNERLRANERRDRLREQQKEKLAKMQDVVKRPAQQTTVYETQKTEIAETVHNPDTIQDKIVKKSMQNSPCSPETATAIAYFFHPNNSEPIELIFNNPGKNEGEVKLIFGDLPRTKEHILKKKMINLNQLLNSPKFKTEIHDKATRRNDIAFKVNAGVTTACSPYVYQSKAFYMSNAPATLLPAQSRESFCKSKNARLPDPIELISILLTGRYPAGLYWTSGRVYKLAPNKTVVTRGNMVMTQSYMLVDYENYAIGFVSQGDYGKDLRAYSVCVIDE